MSSLRPPREARREKNPRYWALNTHPSYRAFGTPEWRDAQGREYRAAAAGASPQATSRLYVRLPTRATPWFAEGAAGTYVDLQRTDGSGETRRVAIVDGYIMGPGHRTGHIDVQWQ